MACLKALLCPIQAQCAALDSAPGRSERRSMFLDHPIPARKHPAPFKPDQTDSERTWEHASKLEEPSGRDGDEMPTEDRRPSAESVYLRAELARRDGEPADVASSSGRETLREVGEEHSETCSGTESYESMSVATASGVRAPSEGSRCSTSADRHNVNAPTFDSSDVIQRSRAIWHPARVLVYEDLEDTQFLCDSQHFTDTEPCMQAAIGALEGERGSMAALHQDQISSPSHPRMMHVDLATAFSVN